MTGRIILIPETTHACSGFPQTNIYPRGTLWRCDECSQKWVLVFGSQYNERYEVWRKLTEQNKEGYDR